MGERGNDCFFIICQAAGTETKSEGCQEISFDPSKNRPQTFQTHRGKKKSNLSTTILKINTWATKAALLPRAQDAAAHPKHRGFNKMLLGWTKTGPGTVKPDIIIHSELEILIYIYIYKRFYIRNQFTFAAPQSNHAPGPAAKWLELTKLEQQRQRQRTWIAYEIQLKLMVGKGKHLTPCQFNVRAHTCARIHGLRKVGACLLHAYTPMTPQCSGRQPAPSCSTLANTLVFQQPRPPLYGNL